MKRKHRKTLCRLSTKSGDLLSVVSTLVMIFLEGKLRELHEYLCFCVMGSFILTRLKKQVRKTAIAAFPSTY
jgi:hypothetical protein